MLLSKRIEMLGAELDRRAPAERRLSVGLFKYWTELRGDKTFPSRTIIHFDAVPGLSEFGFTMSVGEGKSSPTIHYLGTELRKHIDMCLDDESVRTSDGMMLGMSLNVAIRRYTEVMERKEPVAFESDLLDSPGVQFAYRVIMLPFSEDNEEIDFILGAISFKEKSETTLSQHLATDLEKSLQACRELVSAWQDEEKKSRAILYDTLERAYDFQFEALEDPDNYAALCAAAGINHQSRTPFTPLIKLIFGKEYDKTRVSEYAACLSYAKRNGQEPGTLRALIEATEGGIGFMYDRGRGVPTDYRQAAMWYRKAAEHGEAGAQSYLGFMYETGRGVPKNYGEAARWYRKAALQGVAAAQHNLGLLYENGQGVPKNYCHAVQWYEKAARQGHVSSKYNLGVMHTHGRGMPKNYRHAVQWFEEAARQGLARAQFNLAIMYWCWEGTPKNYVLAYMWFSLAAAAQLDRAAKWRDEVEKLMTPAQITKAQAMAAKWRPKEPGFKCAQPGCSASINGPDSALPSQSG